MVATNYDGTVGGGNRNLLTDPQATGELPACRLDDTIWAGWFLVGAGGGGGRIGHVTPPCSDALISRGRGGWRDDWRQRCVQELQDESTETNRV